MLAVSRTPFHSSRHSPLQAESPRRLLVRAHAPAATAADSKPPSPSWPAKVLGLLPSLECVVVLQRVWQLLCKHLWAIVLIYAIKDSLQFLLHRVTHRLTNYAAEVLFKYPIADEVINAWWLVLDQEFLQQYPGYQIVMGALFVVAMPINLLLAATASATTVLLCAPPAPSSPSPPGPSPSPTGTGTEQQQQPPTALTEAASSSSAAQAGAASSSSTSSSTSTITSESGAASTSSSSSSTAAPPTSSPSASTSAAAPLPARKAGWFSPITSGWREAAATLPLVRGMLGRVWWTESVVSIIGLALQAGMMLVITVPWLLPIYLSAQLAGVTTVVHGDRGLKAIESSAKLMLGRKRVVFWPLLALILGVRLVDTIKTSAFAAMPPRLWTEAVELPLVAYVLLQSLRIAASRLQDLLPVGMYMYLQHTHPMQWGLTQAANEPAAEAAVGAAAGQEGAPEAEAAAGPEALTPAVLEAAATAEAGAAAAAEVLAAPEAEAAVAAVPEAEAAAAPAAEFPAAEAPAAVAAAAEVEPATPAVAAAEATAAAAAEAPAVEPATIAVVEAEAAAAPVAEAPAAVAATAEAEPATPAVAAAEATAAPAAEAPAAEPATIAVAEAEAAAAPAAEAPATVAAAPQIQPSTPAVVEAEATAAPAAGEAVSQAETTAATSPPPPPPASP